MYEKYTYEYLLKRALDNVPSDVDKRQGSIIYDALAPTCAELAQVYIELDSILNNFNVQTAFDKYALMRISEMGIERKKATPAVVLAQMYGSFELKKDSRFNYDSLNYYYTGEKQENYYKLKCETSGTIGNIETGSLTPIENIRGLERADIVGVSEYGTDIEDIEELKKRYYSKLRNPLTSGNKYDYMNWTMEVNGVGACKVFPLANGAGTVKIVICNSEKSTAPESLINDVKNHIETLRPIGAAVYVVSAEMKKININANVSISSNAILQNVQDNFKQKVKKYFDDFSFDTSRVSLSKIQNLLFDTNGVEDYENVKLNNSATSIILKDIEIPTIGNISLGVMQ